MRTRSMLRALALGAVFGSFALQAAGAQGAATTGSITGRVTDAASGAPIAAVQVNVVGTTLGAMANAEGVYTIRGVSPGRVDVRAIRVGFAEQKQTVTVTAGQSVTANFQMQAMAVTLTPVVTTATGETRRVEVGNAIAQVDASTLVETRPVTSVGDVLTARAAGVQVLPGNTTGAGARIRIRGTSSLSLSNDPIYVIDGVRMEGASNSMAVSAGGTAPSRFSDLNPDEIESIEVVKGPSAATLYGTDAANGVIVIRTKRGRAGRPQWNVYTEQGVITDQTANWPLAYRSWRAGSTPANGSQCLLTQIAAGSCTRDSLTTFNLFDDPQASPIGTGRRQQYGLQVSGGSEAVRYFVSGEWEDETGMLEMPAFSRSALASQGVPLRDEWERPNGLTKATARANLNVTLNEKADVAISTGYINSTFRQPASDNNAGGLLSNAYGGLGYKYNRGAAGDTLYGYRLYTPTNIFQEEWAQNVDRFITSLNGNWRPTDWLALRGNFGADFTSRVDTDLCRFGECPDIGTTRLGYKYDFRTNFQVYTADVGATGTFQLSDAINSKTTVGVQFYRNVFDRSGAWGEQLPPGSTRVTAGAIRDADESTTESRTLGAFIEEALSFNDRLFVTAALRSDRNSAFGADFGTALYPKLAVSYVVSDEPFFPQLSWVNQLRLRTAYGASGVQPGTTDAVQYFAASSVRRDGAEVPAVVFQALGNQDLKPERSTELEVGVDGTFWNNRVTTELTFYNKNSKDALISRPLPGSLGTGLQSRFENLGEVRNWGWEWLVNAQLMDRDAFAWDVTLNGSHNSNELVDLGGVPPIRGTTTSQIEGYPLNGYWVRPLRSFEDKDGNNIITKDEIVVGDTAEFRGYSQPRLEISFTNGLDFLERRLRLTALLDYKGGHRLYNNTERIRCQSRNNCAGLLDPNASLAEQARTVAMRDLGTASTVDGYIEDASFLRLREVALTYTMPETWAARIGGARRLSATFAARNLAVWTDYTGVDPEANYGQSDVPSDFQTLPPPTYFTLRFNLGF